MLKTTARKWYLAILFLSVFCLLVGCQQTDAGSNTGSVQITPADQIHTENLTLLERVEYSLVPDEVRASVELYTSASIADDGQMGWDSGDQWVLLVRQGEQEFLLYDEYVQYGEVQFWISSLNTNGTESPATEDLDHHIYAMVTTGVGFTMYDYVWDGDEGNFQKSVLLNPENQWNTVHSNKYNSFAAPERVYDIKNLSFQLPEGLTIGEYDPSVEAGGYLILPYAYFNNSDSAPEYWKTAGAISRFQAQGSVEWNNNQIIGVDLHVNHTVYEEVGPVDNMFWPAYLLKAEHDLMTAPELMEYEENGGTDTIDVTSEYWYVAFAKPDEDFGFLVSLATREYTKEEMINFVSSFEYVSP